MAHELAGSTAHLAGKRLEGVAVNHELLDQIFDRVETDDGLGAKSNRFGRLLMGELRNDQGPVLLASFHEGDLIQAIRGEKLYEVPEEFISHESHNDAHRVFRSAREMKSFHGRLKFRKKVEDFEFQVVSRGRRVMFSHPFDQFRLANFLRGNPNALNFFDVFRA